MTYVTNAAWHDRAVRADAIDEIADQFERAAEVPAWPAGAGDDRAADAGWPRRPQSWDAGRATERLRLAG